MKLNAKTNGPCWAVFRAIFSFWNLFLSSWSGSWEQRNLIMRRLSRWCKGDYDLLNLVRSGTRILKVNCACDCHTYNLLRTDICRFTDTAIWIEIRCRHAGTAQWGPGTPKTSKRLFRHSLRLDHNNQCLIRISLIIIITTIIIIIRTPLSVACKQFFPTEINLRGEFSCSGFDDYNFDYFCKSRSTDRLLKKGGKVESNMHDTARHIQVEWCSFWCWLWLLWLWNIDLL